MKNTIQKTLTCNGIEINIEKPIVMGILNLSHDSFFDGGKYNSLDKVVAQIEKMVEEGATIIDVGAQSTRPGAIQVSAQEEWGIIQPYIDTILKRFSNTVFSIDTYKSMVAYNCIQSGFHIINDISAGDDDGKMLETVYNLNVPYIIMHKQGKPETMQSNPQYENVVDSVFDYFVKKFENIYIKEMKDVIIDLGFGFGKTLEHNYTLLRNLEHFLMLKKPILIGLSRKSMIYKLLECSPHESLNATSALHLNALLSGAKILRVHDVKDATNCIKLYEMLK